MPDELDYKQNLEEKLQIDVKEIMMDFERSSFVDEVREYYKRGLIDRDLYVMLSQADLSNKLKNYQVSKTGIIYKVANKLLMAYFRLLYKMLEPVLNSQEKINKKLVLEIIKLKVSKDNGTGTEEK